MSKPWLTMLTLCLLMLEATPLAVHAGNAVSRVLHSSARPVVVHVWDPRPTEIDITDVEQLSSVCRDAGATALLIPPALVSAIANEQASARGEVPGPVPLVAECDLKSLTRALGLDGASGEGPSEAADLTAWKSLGAAAIGIRYSEADCSAEEGSALELILVAAIAAAERSGLGTILLPEGGSESHCSHAGKAAMLTGVAAILVDPQKAESTEEGRATVCKMPFPAYPYPREGEAGGEGGGERRVIELGCWDGAEEKLERLRDAGFGGVLLENACDGSIVHGLGRCGTLIRWALSNRSPMARGGIFGSSNVQPPSERNPRLWAQSMRQAREIMHESAASRNLPAPKLKK